jgi:hypothetical protein
MEDQLVGIFIGGVQKAGTTALHSYFAEHPRLLAPKKKETHFFDKEGDVDWSNPDYERDLHERFYGGLKADRLAYDATPITLFWPPSIARVMAYNPNARFIFVFRDPIERAFSHWCMETDRGEETLPFSQAIREGRDRLRVVPELHRDHRTYSYVERGFYGAQLERALSHIPRQQMMLFGSAELAEDPARILAAVADFLSIPPFPDVAPRRVFAGSAVSGRKVEPRDCGYLRGIFRDDVRKFSELSGLDTTNWLDCSGT